MKWLIKNWVYILLIIFSLTPLLWFVGKAGFLINGVDTNFPLDPLVWFLRRFFLWNSIPNGGIDHSSSVSGIFFHLIQVIPYLFGIPLQGVQVVSFVFWFALIVFSSYWFSKILFKDRPWIQILFVVFYTFNIFAFNAWENSKVSTLSLLASIPIFLGIGTLYVQDKINVRKTLLLSIIGGIVASGTGVNPAYLISLFLTLFVYLLGVLLTDFTRKNILLTLKGYVLILSSVVLINAFWVIPTTAFIFGNISGDKSIDKIGFTNWVDSLSENTSILNVMRMQGLWDWYAFDGVSGTPLYIPYALNYFKSPPFIIFSFLVPALALLSFIFFDKKHKELYVSFGIMILLGVFLGAGTHLPTGSFYKVLLERVPFFSLFRSPWYIFTPLVIVAYAGLLSLLFNNLKISRRLGISLVLILIFGNLLYSYPLVTGKIFRPAKPDGFYVKFPSYVFDFKDKLKLLEGGGRIIGYPDDEIEQFDWGYRGIESIITLFSDREVLFSPLNNLNSPITEITRRFYLKIKRGQLVAALALAEKLDARYIFEKLDQTSLSKPLPEEIKDKKVITSGDWNLFDLETGEVGKIFSPSRYYIASPYDGNSRDLSVVGASDTVLSSADSVIREIPSIIADSGIIITGENSQAQDFANMVHLASRLSNRLVSRDLSKVGYSLEVQKDGLYVPILENYSLGEFGVGGDEIAAKIDGIPVTFKVIRRNDSFTYFEDIFLTSGKHEIDINISNPNLALGGNFTDTIGFGEGEAVNFQVLGESDEQFLSITNLGETDSQAIFNIPNFDPLSTYLIQLNYKQIYGNNALVLIMQNTDSTLVKTQTERLPNYPEWKSFSFFYEPVKTDSKAAVYLVSPQTKDPLGTKIFYDNLEIYKVFTNDLFFVSKGEPQEAPKVRFSKKSPTLYEGEVENGGSHMIVFSENYAKEWVMKVTDQNGKTITKNAPHFSVNFYANAWYIENAPSSYKFEIYYKSQNLLNLGFVISALAAIGGVGYWFFARKND